MTREEIDALDALANVATPGPWKVDPQYECDVQTEGGQLEILTTSQDAMPVGRKPDRSAQAANAAYIAAAHPNTFLDLTARLREVEAENERLRALLEWQPIETAPHGVLVELHSPETTFCGALREITFASHGRRVGGYSSVSHHPSATHWRPLTPGPGETP